MSQKWTHGFCSCFGDCGTCCTGFWCPCILYGKTKYRLTNNGSVDGYSCCNSNCMLFTAAEVCFTPIAWVLHYQLRSDLRQKHNLEGGGCGDFCKVCCCPCCAHIQEEREAEERAGSAPGAGYAKQEGMHYGKH